MTSLLVIGGNSGIGKAIADLAQRTERWDRIWAVGADDCDITDSMTIRNFLEEHGPFEHTVYSAGIASLCMIENLEMMEVEGILDVNVLGFLRVVRELQHSQVEGRILAIVSDASRTPMRGSMAYCISKAALAMAVRVAARELAPSWQVNGLSPCVVEGTPMTEWIDETVPEFRGWSPEAARAYEQSSIPMGRRARLDEVASAALHILVGPEFMTGSIVELTGGK
jgi:NAD(P)-dependent dehydrogenase (short-subunit alcohol dehydrogenase family)